MDHPTITISISITIIMTSILTTLPPTTSNLLSEPVYPTTPNTVPAFPLQPDDTHHPCHLDLSNELFGGVSEACSHSLDRSRCCPVLAAWLYAAHSHQALLLLPPSPSPSPSPASDSDSDSDSSSSDALPMMPESDSQKCVTSLQSSLSQRNITLPQPNSTCDTILCFCGIRLHQIASLSCPAAFNLTPDHRNATPTANVRNLEKSCRNSSYAGCTKCLAALQKLKGEGKNGTTKREGTTSRASKMFSRDCQLMGLTWLLARNKTLYIPTVSAVLRAIMYSAHPHQSKCSPDQENMPLAVDSLQFYNKPNSSPPSIFLPFHFSFIIMILFLVLL